MWGYWSSFLGRLKARREAWIGLSLILSSIAVSFVAAELAVRTLGNDAKRWQWRNFLANPAVTEGRSRMLLHDPLLSYVPRPGYSGTHNDARVLLTFDEHGLRVHHRDRPVPVKQMPPVLLVGDSYAMGEEVDDDETVAAHLQEMLQRRVLNGAVLGYGLDQIVLRAEALVRQFQPDTVVVSFIADDVRRSQMRMLWGVEKPWFDVVDGALVLRGVPVPPAALKPLDPVRAVLGYSFLIDVIMRRLELDDWWLEGQPVRAEEAHEAGDKVSCLLMERLQRLARDHGVHVLLVAQYTPDAWRRQSTEDFEVGIIEPVLACARAAGLRPLDTRDAVEAAVRKAGLKRYYVSRHMTDDGNRLTADLIAGALSSATSSLPAPASESTSPRSR
jgi:hypothetical protein